MYACVNKPILILCISLNSNIALFPLSSSPSALRDILPGEMFSSDVTWAKLQITEEIMRKLARAKSPAFVSSRLTDARISALKLGIP
jgi:hypothetical protein